MYTDELKELVASNVNIVSIWFNADGEWHTCKMDDFTKEVSRDEILKPKVKKDEPK